MEHVALPKVLLPGLPGPWVLLAIAAALVGLLWYLVRIPRDYPFRSALLSLGALALAGVIIAAMAALGHAGSITRNLDAAVHSVAARTLAARRIAPLTDYVPAFPGADTAVRREQPALNGLPAGTIWDETATRSISNVVRYYGDGAHHAGWQVEFSAPTGVVLHRTTTALGQPADERLRIQASEASDDHTRIEFELTRRLK